MNNPRGIPPQQLRRDRTRYYGQPVEARRCGWCTFLILVVSAALTIAAAIYFFGAGLGFAAFLPAWRDHHTEARQEWVAEQGQGPTAVETWMLRVCWVGLVAVLVWGQWFGGVA